MRRRNPHQLAQWHDVPEKNLHSFWQRRLYDFNVWTKKKHIEKLHYMHMNPVKGALVSAPQLWKWSSYRFYQYGENSV